MSKPGKPKLKFHEVADLFPKLPDPDYAALKADIKAHGQRVPIPLYHGKAIEGRARYQVCQDLGIEPATEEIVDPGSLVGCVISFNLHRRHLTSSQLAAVALDCTKLLAKEAAARKKSGKSADGKAGGRGRKKNPPQKVGEGSGSKDKHDGEVAQQAAKLLGTNRQYVTEAKRIREEDPKLYEQVRDGHMTIPQAKRTLGKAKAEKLASEEPPADFKDLEDTFGSVQRMLDRNEGAVTELAPRLTRKPKERLAKQLRTINDSIQRMLRTLEEEQPLPAASGSAKAKS